MGDDKNKLKKKAAKANLKSQKKAAKSKTKLIVPEKEANNIKTLAKINAIQKGVSISIEEGKDSRHNLTIEGLNDSQLQRILPEINKEVLITVTEDKNRIRATFLKFIRAGIWETLIKVIAGLIVGYILIRLGLK